MRRVISLLIIGLLLLINFNLVQSSLSSSKKLAEVGKIEGRIKDLEAENKGLKAELAERDSSYFIEKEARNKLGFGKTGETTIVVASQLIKETKNQNEFKDKSNFEKWLDLIRN